MTVRERFNKVMNFEKPDRLPMIEWAPWWDETVKSWQNEGLQVHQDDLCDYFKLERLEILAVQSKSSQCPTPAYHGAPIIDGEAAYQKIRPHILNDALLEQLVQNAHQMKAGHEAGDFSIRIWLDGFFWFPRSLFGIEEHLYAFYDMPELMHQINSNLAEYNLRALKMVLEILKPDMIGIAEDMSYNHGPMLSYELYKEFLAPYYAKLIPYIKAQGIKLLVDSDGNVMPLLPWLLESGFDGIYPLERQAGVDVAEIRRLYPKLLMMGAYDKMVMAQGEDAMRAEFERLLPVIRLGGFIPSVDQTPPEVSLENYHTYLRLFKEYARSLDTPVVS